jgi:hypothetical protein
MFDTFRLKNNPVSYLTGRNAVLNVMTPPNNTQVRPGVPIIGANGQPMRQPYASIIPSRSSSPLYDMFVAGTTAGTFQFPSGVSFDAQMSNSGHQLDLSMAPAGVATGVRFLPWGPDATTYMQLDNNADVWFTGPLSGCNVYAAGNGRNIWVIHANSNANAANLGANNNAKRTTALNFAATLGAANPLWSHLERGQAGYGGLGYVFGWRKGNNWQNYYNDGAGHLMLLR